MKTDNTKRKRALQGEYENKLMISNLLKTNLQHLGLSMPTMAALSMFNDIMTLSDLISTKEEDLENIHEEQLKEILEFVDVKGFRLGADISSFSDEKLKQLY